MISNMPFNINIQILHGLVDLFNLVLSIKYLQGRDGAARVDIAVGQSIVLEGNFTSWSNHRRPFICLTHVILSLDVVSIS